MKHKLLISAGLTLTSLASWLMLLYLPAQQRIAGTAQSVASLQVEVAGTRQFIAQTAQSLESDQWLTQRRELLTGLERSDSLETFVRRLASDFGRFGIEKVEFSPDLGNLLKNNRIPFGGIKLLGAKFVARCQGRFLALGKALSYLEAQPYFADLYAINFAYNEAVDPDVLFEMSFGVYLREEGTIND